MYISKKISILGKVTGRVTGNKDIFWLDLIYFLHSMTESTKFSSIWKTCAYTTTVIHFYFGVDLISVISVQAFFT